MAKKYFNLGGLVTPVERDFTQHYYIDSSTNNGAFQFAYTNQQTASQINDQKILFSDLFNKINEILTSETRSTTINCTFLDTDSETGNPQTFRSYERNLTIKINWPRSNTDKGSLSYNGTYRENASPHYAAQQVLGSVDFADLSGETMISLFLPRPAAYGNWSQATPQTIAQIRLDLTQGNPKILALPVMSKMAHWLPRGITFTYLIEADDELSTSVQTTPDPVVVSSTDIDGVKISELDEATSLNDDDLLVLSRDDPAGDSYDKSWSVKFASLKEKLTQKYVEGYASSIGGTLVENGALLTVTHDLGVSDVLVQVYIADDAAGTNNVMLNNQTDGSGASLYDYQAQSATSTQIKIQLAPSGWTKNVGAGAAVHSNYDTKFIKVVVLA